MAQAIRQNPIERTPWRRMRRKVGGWVAYLVSWYRY
jgi:hypothetical protein